MPLKLGVLGGTFDPIHLGHLLIAEEARERLGLGQVLFIPTGQPYLRPGSPVASAAHRLAMTRLGAADNPAFDVSAMEVERPGPTYTLDTLEALARERGEGVELFFVLGVDSARTLPRWHEPAQVLARCTPVVVLRPGAGEWDPRELDALAPGALPARRPPAGAAVGRQRHGAAPADRPRRVRPLLGPQARRGVHSAAQAVPGGAAMTQNIRQQVLAMAHSLGALTFGDFVLSSGQRSSYYFDGRLLTLDPRGAYLVSKALTPVVLEHGAEAVGGPTLGADPMVGAMVLTSYLQDKPLRGFLVRGEAKGHGRGRLIEGPLQRGNAAGAEVLAGINPEDSPELGPVKAAILDDACSTGAACSTLSTRWRRRDAWWCAWPWCWTGTRAAARRSAAAATPSSRCWRPTRRGASAWRGRVAGFTPTLLVLGTGGPTPPRWRRRGGSRRGWA